MQGSTRLMLLLLAYTVFKNDVVAHERRKDELTSIYRQGNLQT